MINPLTYDLDDCYEHFASEGAVSVQTRQIRVIRRYSAITKGIV